MHGSTEFSRLIPRLRRYARAITGNQDTGDDLVIATLEALTRINSDQLGRGDVIRIFRLLSQIWNSRGEHADASADTTSTSAGYQRSLSAIAQEPPRQSLSRQVLFLTTVEGFSIVDAAAILDLTSATAELLRAEAEDLDRRRSSADVLIIEDELFVATDLEDIVTSMGHRVVAIEPTYEGAVAAARRTQPILVLADIALAEGGSGIRAAHDILRFLPVPIIFITAYPERLLTGLRPEPTFLIQKPFLSEVVRVTIAQALHFEDHVKEFAEMAELID
ncbi:MAG: response regulator [Pseudomonadota bacterium]